MDSLILTKITRHGQVTLPASIRRTLHLEEGDYIEVRIIDDGVLLTPKKLIDKSQAYFWSDAWQAAEREAQADIAAGRVFEAGGAEDAIVELRRGRD